ncbi:HAD family hydrolase [Kitasatospora sp. P5_F3]
MTDISLVVLDMAGTTVADDGLVERAFQAAADGQGVEAGSAQHQRMLEHVRATMGESKISVFRHLFGAEERAQQANLDFEAAYHRLVDEGHCAALPGAAEAIAELRASGRKVVLTTGFSRATQDRILDALGWQSVADLTLCPAEAGRGRPYPDLALTALLRPGAVGAPGRPFPVSTAGRESDRHRFGQGRRHHRDQQRAEPVGPGVQHRAAVQRADRQRVPAQRQGAAVGGDQAAAAADHEPDLLGAGPPPGVDPAAGGKHQVVHRLRLAVEEAPAGQ